MRWLLLGCLVIGGVCQVVAAIMIAAEYTIETKTADRVNELLQHGSGKLRERYEGYVAHGNFVIDMTLGALALLSGFYLVMLSLAATPGALSWLYFAIGAILLILSGSIWALPAVRWARQLGPSVARRFPHFWPVLLLLLLLDRTTDGASAVLDTLGSMEPHRSLVFMGLALYVLGIFVLVGASAGAIFVK